MTEAVEKLQQQLTEVQSQLAFQDDTVRALNDAVALQQQEILMLRRQLELLKQRQDEQVARQEGDAGELPLDEIPPHY